ncbi:hypothetical protein DL766_007843 [Monosporascus sp. MC13-8B]|nr:hypothetical protein DL766_007843 [Monosporascus sp. MC13-8B]
MNERRAQEPQKDSSETFMSAGDVERNPSRPTLIRGGARWSRAPEAAKDPAIVMTEEAQDSILRERAPGAQLCSQLPYDKSCNVLSQGHSNDTTYDGTFNFLRLIPSNSMSPIGKIVASAAFLASIAVAAPRWRECERGTWYSKCGDVEGCFDHDPCVDPPAASTPACPADTTGPGVRILPSAYWPISPDWPDDTYFAVGDFLVHNNTQGVVQNVLVFEGIDAARAKTCKVGWYVNPGEDTVFEVEGDGYLRITRLDGMSEADMPPSFNSAAALETEDSTTTMPSLGGWDELGRATSNHVEVPCSEVMVFRAYLDEINNGGGEIYMQPSDTVGLSVDYWC